MVLSCPIFSLMFLIHVFVYVGVYCTPRVMLCLFSYGPYMVLCRMNLYPQQTTCDGDYLEIRDGDSMESPLLARYCGTLFFTEITTSGTHILLHFVSDDVTDDSQGFQLQYAGE